MDGSQRSAASQQEEAVLRSLKPGVERLARELKRRCNHEGFSVEIVRGLRSHEEQDALHAQGRTRPGKVITRRRGGESFHNYGVAFDVHPITPGGNEEEIKLYRAAGKIGSKLGLEWGGNWPEFVDMPHFHYTANYTIDEFRNNTVDWTLFNN